MSGWYLFEVSGGRDKRNRYGAAVELDLAVVRGPCRGWKLVFIADAVATPRNKAGRLLRALGFDPENGPPVEFGEVVGRRVLGRVENYEHSGRTRAKVVEWRANEEGLDLYGDQAD